MKVAEAFEPFLTYGRVERFYAAQTQAKLKDCFSAWILPWAADRELEGLTPVDVLQLREAMVDRGVGIARLYSVLMTLKLFCRFCRTTLNLQCLDPGQIRLPRRVAGRVEFLTDQEVARIFTVIDPRTIVGLRLRTLIEILLATGMRISEALSLDRNSISFETGEADIVGKGGKPRTVFFHRYCLAWIERYLARRSDQSPALFVTLRSKPQRWTRRDMSKVFRKLQQKTGITKHLTPHLFRHTFCTHLLQNGADITYIKELAGHQDIDTTARYYLGVDKKALKAVLHRCQIYRFEDHLEPCIS